MPLWLVIMGLGAAGCGWLFLKARQTEVNATYKKIGGGGSKTVKKAAQKVANRPSTMPVEGPVSSKEPVNFSYGLPSVIVKDLEEIMRKKNA